jgi:predicted neuraminidase
MIGFGNIQPSLVQRKDGTVVAFMRDNGPFRRIRMAESKDEGATWGAVSSTDLPNPGAGIEAIRLVSGAWLMVSNDTTAGRHSLALSLSDDEGRTWPVTRHLAYDAARKERFHYPSLIQAKDGSIHVSYTHGNQPGGSAIDHARLNEAWIRAGDPADHPARAVKP